MINALHLIWIIPLSILAGFSTFVLIACLTISKVSKEEEKIDSYIEENKNDN